MSISVSVQRDQEMENVLRRENILIEQDEALMQQMRDLINERGSSVASRLIESNRSTNYEDIARNLNKDAIDQVLMTNRNVTFEIN